MGRIFMNKDKNVLSNSVENKKGKLGSFFSVFTTKNIAGMAIFVALAFVAYCIIPEIPIFPGTPADFLKLDFSNVFIMLAGFMYGPIPAFIITIVKEVLHLPFGTTMGVGEIANIIMTTAYVLFPSIMYHYRKGIKIVILSLVVACVLQIAFSLLVNRFINFPFFIWMYNMPVTASDFFGALWWYVLLFNVIKSVAVSIVTLIVYKRVKYLFEIIKISDKKSEKALCVEYSSSEEETIDIACEYAKSLKNGDVVLLSGDLGAGKTAFVKGVAKNFGLEGVTSPTYAYLNVYGDFIYHYDCYRLSCGEDAERLGLTDYFGGENICLIEWSENIQDVLPKKVKRVNINKISDGERRIEL